MSHKSYRINTKVNGDDKVISVPLKRGINTLNILSLEINQEDAYELHTSDYGVIVGRVLANDAFGVPNVKVSIFIPIDDEDDNNSTITSVYPFKTVQSVDGNRVRYNLLDSTENVGVDGRKKSVGTFPSKNLVLDNDGEIEVFDKYWKYTTTTNKSGDYMIFGVPTGSCQVHYDCDLSNIGIISQKPYDLINKGYDASLFKSPNEFLEDDINSAVHILSQDKTVYVYPFWGDTNANQIGITRNDINLNYQFEPSCIFMGSSITDSPGNYIGTYGQPTGSCGRFASLTTSSGNIEIIRKNQDGYIEEFKENVTGIIDGNGVWCYSIPMNLDRIGTDEEGNIVAINDPHKGIPTRARVRFRLTLTDTIDDTANEYTAKILIPNNPKMKNSGRIPTLDASRTSQEDWENYYEFGSKTPDACFRDLYWGKVYSAKQYYPRIQYGLNDSDTETGKTFNVNYTNYPVPNRQPFSCISSIDSTNGFNPFPYNTMYAGAENGNDTDTAVWFKTKLSDSSTNGGFVEKGLLFCLENDWVNGCVYFPRVKLAYSKEKKTFGYFGSLNDKEGGKSYKDIFVGGRHNLNFIGNKFKPRFDYINKYNADSDDLRPTVKAFRTQKKLSVGILTLKETMFGDNVLYYRSAGGDGSGFYKLYSTDIILLGNISDIYDSLPKLYAKIPSTTTIFPPMSPPKELNESGMNMNGYLKQLEKMETNKKEDVEACDMFCNLYWRRKKNLFWVKTDCSFDRSSYEEVSDEGKAYIDTHEKSVTIADTENLDRREIYEMIKVLMERNSLFFGDSVKRMDRLVYLTPAFINTSRICELDVSNDHAFTGCRNSASTIIPLNGVIDRFDIVSDENRSAFASMNYDIEKYTIDSVTNYKKYIPTPMYLVDFEGRMKGYFSNRKFSYYDEDADSNYISFRYGPYQTPTRYLSSVEKDSDKKKVKSDALLLTENSFYFYFGLYGGQSAIDVFNKKYGKSESTVITEDALVVKAGEYSCVAEKINIPIHISFNQNIKAPIEVYLYKNNILVDKIQQQTLDSITFNVSEYGLYQIVCNDTYNNEYSRNIYISDNSLDIKYEVYSNDKHIKIVEVDGKSSIGTLTKENNKKISFTIEGVKYYMEFSENVVRVLSNNVVFGDVNSVKAEIWKDSCTKRYLLFSFEDTEDVRNTFCDIPLEYLTPFSTNGHTWNSTQTTNASANNPKLYGISSDCSKEEQLAYIGDMMDCVFNGGDMSITSNSYEYTPIAIYPNSESILEGRITTNRQTYSTDGVAVNHINMPHLVGENFPTIRYSINNLQKARTGDYGANPYLNGINCNYFALKHIDSSNDKPGAINISPNCPSATTVGDWTSISNMFKVQTVDKRFDYQFCLLTPLLLPSGYDEISSLSNKTIKKGQINADVFGGIRFDLKKNKEVTSYTFKEDIISGNPSGKSLLYGNYVYEDSYDVDYEELSGISQNITYKEESICNFNKIDKVKYESSGLIGCEGIHFELTDCSPYLSLYDDKIYAMENNTLSLDVSYKSPIVFNHNTDSYGEDDYDICYTCVSEDKKTATTKYRASIKNSSLNFSIFGDSLYEGATYTDYYHGNTKKSTSNSKYDDWAKKWENNFIIGSGETYLSDDCGLTLIRVSGDCKHQASYNLRMNTTEADYKKPSVRNYTITSVSTSNTISDSEAGGSVQIQLVDKEKEGKDTFGPHDYLIIPIKRIYTENENTLLKQGVVYNMGYAYYASEITVVTTVEKEGDGLIKHEIYLYSPFRGTNLDSDVVIGDSLVKQSNPHTVGVISTYNIKSNSDGYAVEYDEKKLKFTVTRDIMYKTTLYFTIENGLRYKIDLDGLL